MARVLPRHLSAPLERSLKAFPVVLLLGARQTGKSTLAEVLGRHRRMRLLTLDDRATLDAALLDPISLLGGLDGPAVIDEVQKAPGLLEAMKPIVDRDRRPGRFLLTGSAHLTTMTRVAETLAGRAALHQLDPFSWAERARRPSPTTIDRLFAAQSSAALLRSLPQNVPAARREEVKARILSGGYPQPSLEKSQAVRGTWFASYRQTYLERDLRDVASVQSLPEFSRLLTLLALRTAQQLNISEVGRDAGLSATTARRYIEMMQQTFQVTLLQPWFANVGKRLVKTPKLYLTDTGMACHLAAVDQWSTLERQERVGALVETFVAGELRKMISVAERPTHLWFWRIEHGPEVDFLLERGGEVVAVECKWSAGLAGRELKSLQACRDALGKTFRLGVLLHGGTEAVAVGERLIALPFAALLGRD